MGNEMKEALGGGPVRVQVHFLVVVLFGARMGLTLIWQFCGLRRERPWAGRVQWRSYLAGSGQFQ